LLGIAAGTLAVCQFSSAAKPSESVPPLIKVAEFKLEEERLGAAAAVYDDVIYIFGGSSGAAISTFEKFDTRTAQLTSVECDLIPRRFHSAIEHDGRFFLFGGQGYGLPGQPFEAVVEIYDPSDGSISHGTSMTQPRAHMGSVKLGDKAYFIGGTRKTGGRSAQTNTVEIFDFSDGTWKPGVPMPTPRETKAVVVTGFIITAGGYREPVARTEVEMFVPEANAWKALPPLSRKTSANTMVFLGEHLFLFGDYYDRHTVLAYNLRTRKSEVYRIPGYTGMRHATTVIWRERIYVIGGNVTTESGNESDLIQIFALNPAFGAGKGE
jgi:N-acetylneuraminic acid mutarotase